MSCKEKSKPDVEPITPDIYLAGGSQSANGVYTARYWKNSNVVELVTSPYFPAAVSIAVSGSDIHMLGQAFRDTVGAFGQYWKNGILTALTKNITPAWVSEIKIFGQDVYITGSGQIDNSPYSSSNYATYWKNGEAVVLADAFNGVAAGIFLSGNDVYLAGMAPNGRHGYVERYLEKGGVTSEAKIWKNGVPSTLPSGTRASSIFVFNNDIYVSGTGNGTPFERATYWKNGEPNFISDGTKKALANSIFVKNP